MMLDKRLALAACLLALLAPLALVGAQNPPSAPSMPQMQLPQLPSWATGGQQQQSRQGQQSQSQYLNQLRNLFNFEMVKTEPSELGGQRVTVHVPGIYDLVVDQRADHGGIRMTQTVLSGLVNIFIDRKRDPNTGVSSGPISVKLGPYAVYVNEDARKLDQSGGAKTT